MLRYDLGRGEVFGMWYGEMYNQLNLVRTDMHKANYSLAYDKLITIINRLEEEGLIINAKLEKGGDDNYKGINQG
jgi:hypothetical protein